MFLAFLICAVTNTEVTLAKNNFLQELRAESSQKIAELQKVDLQQQAEINTGIMLAQSEIDKIIRQAEHERLEKEAENKRIQEIVEKQIVAAEAYNEKLEQQQKVNEIWDKAEEIASRLQLNLSNSGEFKSFSEVYTKCLIAPHYDADYYDVAIPYKLRCKDVGGLAVDVESKLSKYRYSAVSKQYDELYVGERINQEFYQPPTQVGGKSLTVIKDSCGVECYNINGTECYAIALPKGLFPDALTKQGFYGFSNFRSTGIFVDLILTDGQVVHCVVIDGIGEGHSNGYKDGWTASSTSTGQDGVRYKLNSLKYPQYKEFFHAASCHTVEFSGDLKAFCDEFGFYNGNRIKYVRVYKYSVRDNLYE